MCDFKAGDDLIAVDDGGFHPESPLQKLVVNQTYVCVSVDYGTPSDDELCGECGAIACVDVEGLVHPDWAYCICSFRRADKRLDSQKGACLMFGFFRRLIQRYGFFKRAEPRSYFDHIPAPTDAQIVRWGEGARNIANDPEYMARAAQGALNMAPGAVKNRRLAAIARERDALKEQLAKAIRDKKARAPILKKLRELTNEEMRLDLSR